MFKVKITEQAFQPVTQGENVLQPALKKLIILIPLCKCRNRTVQPLFQLLNMLA